jgi:DNA (cytosine-5)-methyltransferase 1
LPEDFPSARVTQIRRGAAAGEGSRSTYYGRLHPDRPAYTISTYFNRPGNGCFIHPMADRLLTVREAARLQGFPDNFRFSGKGRARFVQVGNAVPPLLAYQLARVIPGRTVVDLFSGAGGLALGFAWAGFETLAAADCDVAAVATFSQNVQARRVITMNLGNPDELKSMLRDVRDRMPNESVDVLTGGPPCQGFSTAGKWLRRDDRNDLLSTFVTAVEYLRPRRVVMENVTALAWARGRPFLDSVVRRLREAGYDTAMGILHAETFGLPQLRRRLFLLASRDGDIMWPAPTHAVQAPAYVASQPGLRDATPLPLGPSVLDAIDDLPRDAVEQADAPAAYRRTASTPYQRWARGDLSTEDLMPKPKAISTTEQLELVKLAS